MMRYEIKAYRAFILKITHNETMKPRREINQCDLNRGRYDGGAPKWLRNEIKHKVP